MFEYIVDESFKAILESDYIEATKSFDSECWKSVHVLVGSVMESILIDSLLATGIIDPAKALKLDFGDALKLCRDNKIISESSGELSAVIKSYRNLIHPGRVIRVSETISAETAQVALSLLKIISDDLARTRKDKLGYTADQFLNKVAKDGNASLILPHLVKSLNAKESEKLLITKIPDRILALMSAESYEDTEIKNLKSGYGLVFEAAPDDLKSRVCNKFSHVLRNESESIVNVWSRDVFKGKYLKYADSDSKSLIIDHYIGKAKDKVKSKYFPALEGIISHCSNDQVNPFAFYSVLQYAYSGINAEREAAKSFIQIETERDLRYRNEVESELKRFLTHHKGGHQELIDRLREMLEIVEGVPPF